MKKLLTVLLTLFMVFTLVGCNSKEDTLVVEEPQQQEEVVEPVKEEPEVVGGYVDAKDGTLTDELKDIFTKALDGLTGASYEPQELVATQVVAGTNYKFLANGTKTTNPVTKGTYYITIYKDLQGNVELLDIETIEEKQDEVKDYTGVDFWVVVYDQFGNEVSRTTAKYGTTVKDPDGNDVVVDHNKYFHTYVDYPSPEDNTPAPTPTPVEKAPGLYVGDTCYSTLTLADCGTNASNVTSLITQANTEIVLPNGVTSICDDLFSSNDKLLSITIPNSVTTIGYFAFNGCSNLATINFQSNSQLEIIYDNAFDGCLTLSSITIPNSVTTIGGSAFNGCSALSSINIPSSVTMIGSYAFQDCSTLSSITIPNSVTTIGGSAFKGCSALSSITISNNITEITMHLFEGCINLSSIIIPNGVTAISYNAFDGCTILSSINIPSSVTSIGAKVFKNCTSLNTITFEGTTEQWEGISKAPDWKIDFPGSEVHCSDGSYPLS